MAAVIRIAVEVIVVDEPALRWWGVLWLDKRRRVALQSVDMRIGIGRDRRVARIEQALAG
jgi:hypothetical protein